MCDTCVHTCVGVYNACVDMSVHTRVYMCVYKEPICFLIHISQKATERLVSERTSDWSSVTQLVRLLKTISEPSYPTPKHMVFTPTKPKTP